MTAEEIAKLRAEGWTDCADAIEAAERLRDERLGVVSDTEPVPVAHEERSASDAPVSDAESNHLRNVEEREDQRVREWRHEP